MCSFSTIKYYLLTGLIARHFGGVLDDTVEGKGNLPGGKISFPGLQVGSIVSVFPHLLFALRLGVGRCYLFTRIGFVVALAYTHPH